MELTIKPTTTTNFSVDLNGKVALVTGAGDGIGRAVALALARAGAAVGVNDLNPDRADRVTEEIVAAGRQAMPRPRAVSNKFQGPPHIEAPPAPFTHLHILVNAARLHRGT